jgi:hypothetical protein
MRVVLAHAFGARYDLPIPLALFVLGGAAVVVASFVLVVARPARVGATSAVEEDLSRRGRHVGSGVASLAVLGFLVWAGLTGSQEVAENILPTTFWLLVWIAVPLSCGIVGDWTRPANPFAFLSALADSPRLRKVLLGSEEPVRWPRWLGWWPAVVLYFLVACGELVFNLTLTVPRNTALALVAYAAFTMFAGFLFGPAWRGRGEVFTVLFATWGRLGYSRFGAPGRRGFGGGLDVPFERTGSRVAFVLLLLISVNFDGLLATPRWSRLEHQLPWQLEQHPARLELFRTVTFVVLAVAIAVAFSLFATAAARAGRHGSGAVAGLAGLLPSLLPIAFGYLLVHNLQYVLVNSQLMLPLVGNPVGKESWPLHLPYPFNDDYEVHAHFLPSAFYWYTGVVVIVAVHVVAVVVAHRHLVARGVTERHARVSEYPWLVAMVAYTMLSLWLIAQPLVKETGHSEQSTSPTLSSALPSGPSPGVARPERV